MNRIQVILVAGLIFFCQQLSFSQDQQNSQFLQTVGVLDSVYSDILQENRQFYVQLPASYDPNSNEKYPVVYILDGRVFLPTVYDVQRFYSGGFTPDMVLIGISNASNRTRDLTTSQITVRRGMQYQEENGGAEAFSTFIETELIPLIESKYPVSNFRTLIGHSYAGLFTIHTLINNPHMFSNYIAIDPSLDWDEQKLLNESKEKLTKNNYEGKSLFMSLGGQLHMQNPAVTIDNVMQDTSEYTLFARSNIAFSDLVKKHMNNGLAFGWKFYPNDLHGTIPFPSIMDGLIFDFQWYQMENTDKFNSPDTPKEELSDIINYRAEKLERYFKSNVPPYPADLLNMLGYMSLDMEQQEKSKMFFEFAMKFFPESPNSYDSMADFYERTGDKAMALKYVTKAYEMDQNDYYKKRIEELKNK